MINFKQQLNQREASTAWTAPLANNQPKRPVVQNMHSFFTGQAERHPNTMTEPSKFACMRPYDAGQLAAKEGKGHWDNPHASPCANQGHFHAWYAGWCFQMQLLGGPKP